MEKLKTTIDKYGNEAIYINYATGMYSATGRVPIQRLLSLLGGYVNQGYDYSTHMLQAVMPYMYGSASNIADPKTGLHKTLGKKATKFSPYDNVNASSFSEAEAHSDLVVMFGNSPAETRMGGANAVWDYALMREAVLGRGGKIVNIDFRLNESSSGHPDEWLPIRPGTDAALVSAIAYEWIKGDKIDKEFLDSEIASEKGKIVVNHTIGMAKDLHLQVIAEGVETKAHVDFLKNSNCDIAQGFYFAKPMPVPEFERIAF